MNKKKLLFVFLMLFGLAAAAMAGQDFTQLNTAGTSSKESTQGVIKSWLWVASLFPLGIGGFLVSKVKEYQERQEEQGQYEPKVAKYTKLIGAFIGGILITFLLYGILGTVFFNKGFGEMWQILVVDFYSGLI